MKLLKQLCQVHATAGNEGAMKDFIMAFVNHHQHTWQTTPIIHEGGHLQDNLILEFGKPRTAIFAHMDSVGYTVGYFDQLIPIGSPQAQSGDILTGEDYLGPIECKIGVSEEGEVTYLFPRAIARGTDLVYKCRFKETDEFVQSCYLDNRLGIFNLLELASDVQDGVLVFSCREEHGGGSIPLLAKYIYEKFAITQTLISDITWVTDGIIQGEGVAISLRDQGIPRKQYLQKIVRLAQQSGIQHQLEVESSGSSDARELQASPYPIDWCFIGAPESGVHSPQEQVHKRDIASMLSLYKYLMEHL